ncbi:MAG: hypothetical protein JWO08_3250 [Verrucomicrobiaceae bacterium]|nr:hypothetical protein [Verrucomicrobiaceae bacterium]
MTISMPASTSKNSGCKCSKDCGCCLRKKSATHEQPKAPGFLARRPWLWVFVAFGIMLSAWTVMFTLALKNQPQTVPLVSDVDH